LSHGPSLPKSSASDCTMYTKAAPPYILANTQLYMRCACARGRPSDCQPRPHSQQQTLQLISQHLSTSAALPYCNNDLRDALNAFQCIAQPNTALLECILYLTYYLRSRHFTGLCKSVHPWGRVSEIQSIKGSLQILRWAFALRSMVWMYSFHSGNSPADR